MMIAGMDRMIPETMPPQTSPSLSRSHEHASYCSAPCLVRCPASAAQADRVVSVRPAAAPSSALPRVCSSASVSAARLGACWSSPAAAAAPVPTT